MEQFWKVGQLARRTGLTVRALHHYDEIGLLSPSHHSESGHRLYTAADVARLQAIASLRRLGLSLDEIRDCLATPSYSLRSVLDRHVARLREQIALQQQLCSRLEAMSEGLAAAQNVPVEEYLKAVEEMTMIESGALSPEQRDQITNALAAGDDHIALFYAASYGETELVRTLLARGVDVNTVDDDGLTALTCAAGRGHGATALALLEAGASVNIPNEHGLSPLMYAAWNGDLELVKALLAKGADVSCVSVHTGRTALACAMEKGHLEIAVLLESRLATP